MKTKIYFLFSLVTLGLTSWSQGVGINETGANPDPSAILDASSTSKGFLPPRMTTAQRNAIINPANGLQIYNTTTNCLQVNIGTPSAPNWDCASTVALQPQVNCDVNGFVGYFAEGINFAGRSFSVSISNNTYSPVILTFAASDLVLTGVGGMSVGSPTGNPALSGGTITFNPGQSVTVTYPITGAPTATGTLTATWNKITLNCVRTVSVVSNPYPMAYNHCNASNPTQIVDVINPLTNKTWMDRNLGANRAATSSTDAQSYGSFFQWGRRADGHQCVNRYTGDGVTTSSLSPVLSNTNEPIHGFFIYTSNMPFDWRLPQLNDLWQGINGVNNPCPSGYRLPSSAELNGERLSWVQAPISSTNNATGAFASPLKLPMAGYRTRVNGLLMEVGTRGCYWTSTPYFPNSVYLNFGGSFASEDVNGRAEGFSVRCIKN